MKVLAAALVAAAVVGVAQCGLVVVTEGGRIQGTTETSLNGRTFNSFYSIPYARAPIGAYRFKVSASGSVVACGYWYFVSISHLVPPTEMFSSGKNTYLCRGHPVC